MERQEIKNEVRFHADEVIRKYGESRFMFCGLYGSQNYGLDTPTSDVDTKAIVLPTIHELMHYKKVSQTFVVRENEEGQCDVKHIQLMFENFMKQNINFLELLYTPYYIVADNFQDLWGQVVGGRDLIAGCNVKKMIHTAVGMSEQKYVAMEKRFESKIPLIDKYGYDPKQLASMLRLEYFCEYYLENSNFEKAIHPEGLSRDTILSVKAAPPSLAVARRMANDSRTHFQSYIDRVASLPSKTKEEEVIKTFLDKIAEIAVTRYLKGEKDNGGYEL